MSRFVETLGQRLADTRAAGLWRALRRLDSAQGPWIESEGQRLLNFSSNDYLGLANHPEVVAAAAEASRRWGAGAGASRLVCGSLAPQHELEAALAAFKGTPSALVFASGYAAAVGTIPALVGPGDVVVLDRLAHACLVDGARLSGAKLRVFAHNDLEDLEQILRWARATPRVTGEPRRAREVLIVTESVFSMDGDVAPLRALVALKERYDAWLLLDEAHATGLYGETRRGLAEFTGVADRIEIQMGTLGKALGSAGGYLCGARELVDLLVNRARTFLFSTAPVPAQTAAAQAALRIVQSAVGERLTEVLWQRVAELRSGLAALSWGGTGVDVTGDARPPEGQSHGPVFAGDGTAGTAGSLGKGGEERPRPTSAIVPLILGDERLAVAAAQRLRESGLLVPAIRYPTVARGAARLRITLSAAHTAADVQDLLEALAPLLRNVSGS